MLRKTFIALSLAAAALPAANAQAAADVHKQLSTERFTLVSPFPVRVSGPGAYYLVTSAAKSELPRVKLFRKWLLEQL